MHTRFFRRTSQHSNIYGDGTINIDNAVSTGIGAGLQTVRRRYAYTEAVKSALFGTQLIWELDDGSEINYCAGSDHRKDGHAVGF